jgi:IS1 family transposase
MYDKSQTHSVDGDNAELRRYLSRLTRKSRCFSKGIKALRRAVELFVGAGTNGNCASSNARIIR